MSDPRNRRATFRHAAIAVLVAALVAGCSCSKTTDAPVNAALPVTGGTVGTQPAGTEPGTTATEIAAAPTTAPPPPVPLPPRPFQVATPKANGPLAIYPSIDAPAATQTLANPVPVNKDDPSATVPLVLLVKDAPSPKWFEVYLPIRPNDSTGFIRASDVTIQTHDYHIEVNLGAFNLKAFNGDKLILDVPVAVAAENTPTPGGLYYTTELLKPPPKSGYGTYAYGLSGFSEALTSFNGGPGQLGIHGTDDPGLIGQRVSHGCIRMRNEDIEKLVPLLPLGVPVQVFA